MEEREPIRILHVFGKLDMGGAESRIMELYRCIDTSLIQFDFLVHLDDFCDEAIMDDSPGAYAEEVRKRGGKIYSLPRFRVYNTADYKKAAHRFFADHTEFSVIQGHMTSTASMYLPIAKQEYKKIGSDVVTIAHSRNAGVSRGVKGIATKMIRRGLGEKADYAFACSREAADAVFGKEFVRRGEVRFIPNAIDSERFRYNSEVRKQVRVELGIPQDAPVIGHVGRFFFMKNHEYIVRIFAEIYKKKKDAYLLLVGGGDLMGHICELVGKIDASMFKGQGEFKRHVIFAGKHYDVERYYQAFDVFVFPSLFEGLPGVVVEAQDAGLPCLISRNVTREVGITELAEFRDIGENPSAWAERILEILDQKRERRDRRKEICEAGFDVHVQAERMTDFYLGRHDLKDSCYK